MRTIGRVFRANTLIASSFCTLLVFLAISLSLAGVSLNFLRLAAIGIIVATGIFYFKTRSCSRCRAQCFTIALAMVAVMAIAIPLVLTSTNGDAQTGSPSACLDGLRIPCELSMPFKLNTPGAQSVVVDEFKIWEVVAIVQTAVFAFLIYLEMRALQHKWTVLLVLALIVEPIWPLSGMIYDSWQQKLSGTIAFFFLLVALDVVFWMNVKTVIHRSKASGSTTEAPQAICLIITESKDITIPLPETIENIEHVRSALHAANLQTVVGVSRGRVPSLFVQIGNIPEDYEEQYFLKQLLMDILWLVANAVLVAFLWRKSNNVAAETFFVGMTALLLIASNLVIVSFRVAMHLSEFREAIQRGTCATAWAYLGLKDEPPALASATKH